MHEAISGAGREEGGNGGHFQAGASEAKKGGRKDFSSSSLLVSYV